MSYIDKISQLIKAIEKAPNAEEELDYLLFKINGFARYVSMKAGVSVAETKIKLKYCDEKGYIFDREGYQKSYMELDERIRFAHNRIIASIKSLNKMYSDYGLEPIFTGNVNDRYEVAEMACNIIFELYKHEINRDRDVIEKISEEKIDISDKMSLDQLIESCKIGLKNIKSDNHDKNIEMFDCREC